MAVEAAGAFELEAALGADELVAGADSTALAGSVDGVDVPPDDTLTGTVTGAEVPLPPAEDVGADADGAEPPPDDAGADDGAAGVVEAGTDAPPPPPADDRPGDVV